MTALPDGTRLTPLTPHDDARGRFLELHRLEWETGVEPVQWNVVRTAAGVLRGVHVHPCHDDYLVVHDGRAVVGLRDLRPGSPTAGLATCVELDGDAPAGLTIPHGVAHGFWFPAPATHTYAVTHYWDPDDEIGCRWDDPALEIPWPMSEALISAYDQSLGTLVALEHELQQRWSVATPSP